ncbi:MAG TPA: hypothetical protein VGP06_04140 [Janthinobacterium sp.]|nr:hypothetical protein [Janthinobacterium sp.]
MGAKACGGPEFYLAWSDSGPVTAQELHALAARYADARRAANRAGSAMASDCRIIADPGAMCVKPAADAADTSSGKCILRAPGSPDPV